MTSYKPNHIIEKERATNSLLLISRMWLVEPTIIICKTTAKFKFSAAVLLSFYSKSLLFENIISCFFFYKMQP